MIGYGISERLLPGVLHFARSVSAEGRLEQPLRTGTRWASWPRSDSYWPRAWRARPPRPAAVRLAATAAAAPLAMGLYLSFSRGALFACVAGLIALVVLAPEREQLRALAVCVVAGALASVCAAPFKGVTAMTGPLGTQERQGAITLALLVVIMLAAVAVQWRAARSPAPARSAAPRLGLDCARGDLCGLGAGDRGRGQGELQGAAE